MPAETRESETTTGPRLCPHSPTHGVRRPCDWLTLRPRPFPSTALAHWPAEATPTRAKARGSLALAWGRGWRAARFTLESVQAAAAEVEEGEVAQAGHVAHPALRGRCLRTGPLLRYWGLPPRKRAGVQGARATVRGWPQLQHQVSERRRPALAALLRYLQLNLCPDSMSLSPARKS